MIPVSGAARVRAALAGEAQGAVVDGTPETYEILRIESGMPRLGADFGEDAFPEEAGLGAARRIAHQGLLHGAGDRGPHRVARASSSASW